MTSLRQAPVAAAAAVLALAGCTGGPSSTDTASPTPISSAVAAGQAVVCGVAVADVELATGLPVGRSDDQIVVRDGAGTGMCEASSDEAEGDFFVVEMYPLDDAEAQQVRAAIDSEQPGPVRAPDIRFDPKVADGGAWGVGATPDQYVTEGPHSRVFWGDTMIEVYLTQSASWRTSSDDLLAMTLQVAQSYGLERSGSAG